MINPSVLLHRALQADAIASGAMAILLASGATALAPALDLPEVLLRETGLFLIVYAVLVGWLSSRAAMPRLLIWTVIAGNALWALGSAILLVDGAVTPNLLGETFVAVQAIAVGLFAELQYLGLRRSDFVVAA